MHGSLLVPVSSNKRLHMNKVKDRFFRNDDVSMNNFDSIKYGATSTQQKDGFTNRGKNLREHVPSDLKPFVRSTQLLCSKNTPSAWLINHG
jgi:hypothetical protein